MSLAVKPAPLWQALTEDIHQRLRRCLDEAYCGSPHDKGRVVFFRADDVGVPGQAFYHLVNLFRSHRVPLTMAVVPAWLTRPRWRCISELCETDWELWAWMQHGWRHHNHEPLGKKQEFGPSRSLPQKRRDLQLGFTRLGALLGERFLPAFTPPWNRCDRETLSVLPDIGYRALSLFRGTRPAASPWIIDYPVGVDLHTRKEKDSESSWQSLFAELGENLTQGFCGIMIHHQRMNAAAFDFLDLLLSALKKWNHARLVHLGHLIDEGYRLEY